MEQEPIKEISPDSRTLDFKASVPDKSPMRKKKKKVSHTVKKLHPLYKDRKS